MTYKNLPWVIFRGYICTSNADGSIPLNAVCVADARGLSDEESERIVSTHNELLKAAFPA